MSATKFVKFAFVVLFLAACSPAATATPTATQDLSTPMAMTSIAQTKLAEDAQATADAQSTAAAQSTADAAATAQAEAATATRIMEMTQTAATSQARSTETAATRTAATQQAIMDATAQAQPMVDLLAQIQSEGFLISTSGSYGRLDDFDESWAQLSWFQWYPTFLSPADFVIRADIEYESASNTADWWFSGCGFVFREQSDVDFYVVFINLDGNVELMRWKNGTGATIQRAYFGKMDIPLGSVEMVLVVEGTFTTVYIDGERVVRASDSAFDSGELYYTISSGTNAGFGTRCTMTNVDLWEIE